MRAILYKILDKNTPSEKKDNLPRVDCEGMYTSKVNSHYTSDNKDDVFQ